MFHAWKRPSVHLLIARLTDCSPNISLIFTFLSLQKKPTHTSICIHLMMLLSVPSTLISYLTIARSCCYAHKLLMWCIYFAFQFLYENPLAVNADNYSWKFSHILSILVWRGRGKIIGSVLCSIVCNNCAHYSAHMNRPNSSLDWVLSHWAHFTVLRFIYVVVL